jgi:RNA recognition motif-containing protein
MPKKLYVGNLSYSTTEDDIREAFAKFGEVRSAKLIIDPTNGRSKGFGFVEMAADEDGEKAISALNGTDLHGRAITVNEARPQRERGGGGRGPGGYGGGRGRRDFGGGRDKDW